ncbi:Sds3-like-domain-containing protein [Dissophora ornata]|nr:Sds3-like-domain-containing protein [Dissophora ornata]
MPPPQKAVPSSSSVTESKHSNSNHHHHHHHHSSTSNPSKKVTASSTGRSQRGPGGGGGATQGNKDSHRSNSKQPSASTGGGAPNYYDAHSESEDSYTAGGGFISEMDEHDSAFDGAMEYDGEDGRSLLGDDFDASSDVAIDTQDGRKEKRTREFQERLLKLELEFEENKQTIFKYQMDRYKEEMNAILNGVHPDFHDQMQDLAETRDAAIANARLYRDYQFECAQHAYELETEQAEEEYMTEREGLREKMLAVIDNKRRALRDDKENLDISNDFALEPSSRANHTRRLRKRGQEAEVGAKNSKRKPNAPPMARWLATDTDALDDLNSIRKVSMDIAIDVCVLRVSGPPLHGRSV